MSFFDDSHVTQVGMQGSAGPSVGFLDMITQGFQQQYRVDSARALDEELRNRWLESLRSLNNNGGGKFDDPVDPLTYKAFAEFTRGQPISVFRTGTEGTGYGARFVDTDPTQNPNFQQMLRANEAIKKLGNPEVKSFEQILEEVSQMQQGVEAETGSMSERSGTAGVIGQLIGAIGGSFTTRDPLNIVTAPIGAGRTVAMRIASEMGIAAAVVGATEIGDVGPNRALANLPERNPLYNIAAATIGAGVIRGGIEGVGAGVRSLRERFTPEDIDFDLRDSQLQQMFAANSERPSARAASSILDDTTFIERNNPYGEGRAAQERFIAELRSVQRAMNGEPMTAVGRVMPPVPYEYIKKAADFEVVREQAPELYARMEAAQDRLNQIEKQLNGPLYHGTAVKFEDFNLDYKGTGASTGIKTTIADGVYLTGDKELAASFVKNRPGAHVRTEYVDLRNPYILQEGELITRELGKRVKELGHDGIIREFDNKPLEVVVFDPKQITNKVSKVQAERRVIRTEYQAAYRAVEAEAAAINARQRAVEAAQQRESVNILASQGLPFVGPLLRQDSVEALVERINKFNDTLDERAAARFVRESVGEGEDKVEVEAWKTDEGIDIGLRDPVDPEFRFVTDEGEMTVAQAMRDLQDDADLVEAIKGCAI